MDAGPAAQVRDAGAKAADAVGVKVDEALAKVVHAKAAAYVKAAGVLVQVVGDRARADVARVKAARVVAAGCRRARRSLMQAPLKGCPTCSRTLAAVLPR